MNATINFISFSLITFISLIFYNLCYAKLNNHKININLKNILIMLMAVILIMLNNKFNSIVIKLILNIIIFSTELKLIFNDSYKKVIINYVLLYSLIILIEVILTNILLISGVLKNNASANSLSLINVLLNFSVCIIQYLLILISFVNVFFKNIIDYFIKNNAVKNTIISLFLSIALISTFNVQNFGNEDSIKLLILICIIFIYLFTDIIRLRYHEETLKNSNHKLIEYNSKYAKFLDEYKIYKHNINHKLSGMKAFGNKKINSLIDELLNKETTFSVRNNNIYKVPNGIKGIVAEKLYNKDYDIMIHNKIKKDYFSKLSPQAFDSISECLGIALDNAIEACEETENPVITIDIYENKENVCIKIGNTFKNSIDIDKIGSKYYSTKNRGSGLGLFSIKKNKLVKEKITIINEVYYIELQIKKAREQK